MARLMENHLKVNSQSAATATARTARAEMIHVFFLAASIFPAFYSTVAPSNAGQFPIS